MVRRAAAADPLPGIFPLGRNALPRWEVSEIGCSSGEAEDGSARGIGRSIDNRAASAVAPDSVSVQVKCCGEGGI